MARIRRNDVDRIREAIEPLDTETARATYLAGDFPRSDRVKDLDKRYRWDLFWTAGGWRILPDDASELLDAHIDTALRSIVPNL